MPEERKRLRPLIHPPLPGSKPQAIWPTIANTAPCSISITSWNTITGRSSAGSARVSIFAPSGELGTIAGYEAIHMIRKGQACWSAVGAKVGLLHRFIVGMFGFGSLIHSVIAPHLPFDSKVATLRQSSGLGSITPVTPFS